MTDPMTIVKVFQVLANEEIPVQMIVQSTQGMNIIMSIEDKDYHNIHCLYKELIT